MVPIVNNIRENRIRWLWHVLRKEKTGAVRVVREFILKGRGKEEDQKNGGGYSREWYMMGKCKWGESSMRFESFVDVKDWGGWH